MIKYCWRVMIERPGTRWTCRPTGHIALRRIRRRKELRERGMRKLLPSPTPAASTSKLLDPKMYVSKRAHDSSHTCLIFCHSGQRKAPPCSPRGPNARRSPTHCCRSSRTSRSWQDDAHQILDQAIHQTDAFSPNWTSHRRHLEAQTPHILRVSLPLSGRLHGCCQDS